MLFGLISAMAGAATYGKLIRETQTSRRLENFVPVTIRTIAKTTEPHVVTEGYVTEVKIQKDGDRLFRIVQDPEQTEPFVICELIKPIRLPTPEVGSRVRVFGVSRFDSKENHKWHEIHPVLNIEVLNN